MILCISISISISIYIYIYITIIQLLVTIKPDDYPHETPRIPSETVDGCKILHQLRGLKPYE